MADNRNEDRGFLGRTADEVRSWFGDDEAEHRQARERGEPSGGSSDYGRRSVGDYPRGYGGSAGQGAQSWNQAQDEPGRGHYGAEQGGRYTGQRQGYGREHGTGGFQGDYRGGSGQGGFGGRGDDQGGRQSFSDRGHHHDPHYLEWRERQIAELDRDYHDYQQERARQFHQDFSTWRQNRQMQRGAGASTRAAESVRPSDMAGGNAGQPTGPQAQGGQYAGEPGPAGIRGENHMDPLKVDETADPSKT